MSGEAKVARAGFLLLAAPVVVATGVRIARQDRRVGFAALIAARKARSSRLLPAWLARPERLAEAVERLLPLVPPRRYGPCLRRSLLLLELWSRCGLEPTLHVGFRLSAPSRGGHAWLSATADDGRRLQVSGPLDTVPLFEL